MKFTSSIGKYSFRATTTTRPTTTITRSIVATTNTQVAPLCAFASSKSFSSIIGSSSSGSSSSGSSSTTSCSSSNGVGSDEPYILYEKIEKGTIGVITLNDPRRLNCLTAKMGDEFVQLVNSLTYDCDVNCIIVKGAGKAFSAGGDLQFLRERHVDTPLRNSVIMKRFYERFLSVRRIPVPVIAAMHGSAIGAGLSFALAADMRIASKNTKMGLTFTRIGLHPGMGCTHFLRKIAGTQVAYRMCLTGDVIKGEEAERLGIIMKVVDSDEDVMTEAIALAKKCAAGSSIAVRTAVRSLRAQDEDGLEGSLIREADAQSQCYNSFDLLNGVNAVAEKIKVEFDSPEDYLE